MFRKLALSVFVITITFLLTACGGFANQKSTPGSDSNDQVATTSAVKKAKSLIKDGQLDEAHRVLKNEQKKAAKNVEVNQLLASVDNLTVADNALKNGDVGTAKAELSKARDSSNSQEVATKVASYQQQASQLEKANTLFSTIQINLNQKNIGAAQDANEELQAINGNVAKIVEIQQQATKLMQGQEENTTSDNNATRNSDSSGMSEQQTSSPQNFSNQEMTTVLNNFRAASGITFNAQTQFNLTKISADVYQVDVKNTAPSDSSNSAGTYRYNIKSGIVQKMNPETGSFGGK